MKSIIEHKLLEMARSRDEKAYEELFSRYQFMFKGLYKNVHRSQHDMSFDEAMQACRIGLYNAIHYYREDRNYTLGRFIKLCVTRELWAWLKKEADSNYCDSYRHMSLDSHLQHDDSLHLHDVIYRNDDPFNTATMVSEKMIREDVMDILDHDSERMILKYRLEGYSYLEIAELMNMPYKTVDNTMQRIRKKLKSYRECLYV